MKKTLKSCLTLLIALSLICAPGVCAYADSTVTYGADRQFRAYPDFELFNGFKSVMPGDTFTETITIRNDCTASQYVYIYLQAVPHNSAVGAHVSQVAAEESYASMMDFLSQLTLTVTQNGRVLSRDTADKPAGLAGRNLIGIFHGRGQSAIQVTLSVPVTMGNEYANRMGEIDWLFTAEEWNTPINLRTGDDSNVLVWAGLAALSVLALSLALVLVRRKKSRG